MQQPNHPSQLLDFEISFYERLVGKYPDMVDALTALAESYTRKGEHDKGLNIDLRLTKIKKDDPIIWYNLSCSYSLLNRIDESFEALQQAISFGYDDLQFLKRDSDLRNLRKSKRFSEILTTLNQRTPSTAN